MSKAGRNLKLKVCGMRHAANILDVAFLRPDYMGFIFYAQSPRYVGDDFVMPGDISPGIARVGVFVNDKPANIIRNAERHGLTLVQLHGDESPEDCREIRSAGIGVIKVFSVDDSTDFESTKAYAEVSDYFLFDTRGKYYGGNARVFNWEILHKYDQHVPFFLSGGLSAAHVEGVRALSEMNLHALDVNSGVESAPAQKDVEKVREIMKLMN